MEKPNILEQLDLEDKRFKAARKRFLVFCIICLVLIIALPIPATLLDILLTSMFGFALIALVASMVISKMSVLSVCPGILFGVTIFRIAISFACARPILSHGDAGQVITTIGNYVTSSNFVVGTIIFIIFAIVQFVIITKGRPRMAEVAARFTLDAMPGKQMAIDADLNAGRVTEEEARKRREGICREADFFGAMDGVSKFFKEDAMIGLIITGICIICGFTKLAIGYGLATQIPGLIISISVGIMVRRRVKNRFSN